MTETGESVGGSVAQKEGSRKKIKQMETMVAEVIQETPDTVSLVLFTGNDRLEYEAGHFLTIDSHQLEPLARWTEYLESEKEKKEPARAYSLASSPLEKFLKITVKEERFVFGKTKYPPLLSPLLVRRTPAGTPITITGFTGPYVLPDDIESRTDHVVHICAGSGVVPNFSMIKYALESRLDLHHTLIYGSKAWDDIIFAKELDNLRARYSERLKVIHCLSREPHIGARGSNVHAGRVSEAMLQKYIVDPSAAEIFVCGPAVSKYEKKKAREKGEEPTPRFLDTVLSDLQSLGVPKNKIHKESYG